MELEEGEEIWSDGVDYEKEVQACDWRRMQSHYQVISFYTTHARTHTTHTCPTRAHIKAITWVFRMN